MTAEPSSKRGINSLLSYIFLGYTFNANVRTGWDWPSVHRQSRSPEMKSALEGWRFSSALKPPGGPAMTSRKRIVVISLAVLCAAFVAALELVTQARQQPGET